MYVGGVEAAYVYEWTNANIHNGHPADLYTYHKMQNIVFSIPENAPDGATSINVNVNGVISNNLPFTVRSGTIYHVKTTGVDTGNGSGTNGDFNHPWRTPMYYTNTLAGVSAGSICYIHNGVSYTGSYGVYCSGKEGTEVNPYFISAYPGANVVFTHTSGAPGAFGPNYDNQTGGGYIFKYWHISKITLKAGSRAYVYIKGGRIIACGITDSDSNPCICEQGGLISAANAPDNRYRAGLDGNIFLGNYIYDYCKNLIGDKQQHVMYLQNRSGRSDVDGFEVGWNYLKNNWGNGGIHVYDEWACVNWPKSSIHDNVVEDQRGWGIGVGVGCSTGYGPVTTTFNVYNNLIIRSGRGQVLLIVQRAL